MLMLLLLNLMLTRPPKKEEGEWDSTERLVIGWQLCWSSSSRVSGRPPPPCLPPPHPDQALLLLLTSSPPSPPPPPPPTPTFPYLASSSSARSGSSSSRHKSNVLQNILHWRRKKRKSRVHRPLIYFRALQKTFKRKSTKSKIMFGVLNCLTWKVGGSLTDGETLNKMKKSKDEWTLDGRTDWLLNSRAI